MPLPLAATSHRAYKSSLLGFILLGVGTIATLLTVDGNNYTAALLRTPATLLAGVGAWLVTGTYLRMMGLFLQAERQEGLHILSQSLFGAERNTKLFRALRLVAFAGFGMLLVYMTLDSTYKWQSIAEGGHGYYHPSPPLMRTFEDVFKVFVAVSGAATVFQLPFMVWFFASFRRARYMLTELEPQASVLLKLKRSFSLLFVSGLVLMAAQVLLALLLLLMMGRL